MSWYYANDGIQSGPVSEAEFQDLVRAGTIQPSTMIWREGMPDWQPYSATTNPQSVPGGSGLKLQRDLAGPAGQSPVTPGNLNPAAASGGGVICAECGRSFAPSDVIRHGNSFVCASCKPIFLQKMKEGMQLSSEMEYAGFWIRFAAKFIDGIILFVVNMIINLLQVLAPGESAMLFSFALMGLNYMIGALYSGFFLSKFGATPGKMACKLKVVTPEGESISFLRGFARYFAEILSSLILLIGYIMAAFDDEKRALHDRICNTRVIRA